MSTSIDFEYGQHDSRTILGSASGNHWSGLTGTDGARCLYDRAPQKFPSNVAQGTARFGYVNLSGFTYLVYTPSFRAAVCTLLR